MITLNNILSKWSETSLVLRILAGLMVGAVLGLAAPQLTGIRILGVVFVSALKAIAPVLVAVGFIIGVVQDSVETALNSSGDVFFTATAEFYDRKKKKQV